MKNTNSNSTSINTVAPQRSAIASFCRDTRGLSTVEYMILLVVVVVGCVALWNEIGEKLIDHLEASRDSINDIGAKTDL